MSAEELEQAISNKAERTAQQPTDARDDDTTGFVQPIGERLTAQQVKERVMAIVLGSRSPASVAIEAGHRKKTEEAHVKEAARSPEEVEQQGATDPQRDNAAPSHSIIAGVLVRRVMRSSSIRLISKKLGLPHRVMVAVGTSAAVFIFTFGIEWSRHWYLVDHVGAWMIPLIPLFWFHWIWWSPVVEEPDETNNADWVLGSIIWTICWVCFVSILLLIVSDLSSGRPSLRPVTC